MSFRGTGVAVAIVRAFVGCHFLIGVLSSAHCGVEDDSEEMSSGCGVGDVCRERDKKEESRCT